MRFWIMADAIANRFNESDRRRSNYWLRDALEMALYQRFCKKGGALILHGKRHSGTGHPTFANFALLDEKRELILIKVVPHRPSLKEAQAAVSKLRDHVATHRKLTLQNHAIMYCQHGVDVAVWFEYRGSDRIQNPTADHPYGWLNKARLRCFNDYITGDDPVQALKILREDYQHIVGGTLDDLSSKSVLKVGLCILIAEEWPTDFTPGDIDGIKIELWRNLPPAEWLISPSDRPR